MKVILVMVSTLNSKITKGDDPDIYHWTSPEDKDFFFSMLQKHSLTVMGSATYQAAKDKIKPEHERRRIILTRSPETYRQEEIPGKIEFSNESPKKLAKRLEEEGYEEMLLVGGGETNKGFFMENLVTDIYLTVEPKLFGKGKSFVVDGDFTCDLELRSQRQLNKKGTLLLHYKVKQ